MNITHNLWPEIKKDDRRLAVSQDEVEKAKPGQVTAFFSDLKSAPANEAGLDAQLLFGDQISILDKQGDWLKVHVSFDLTGNVNSIGYVGWVLASTISTEQVKPTHMVIAPRTFLYPGPDMKFARSGYRSMGSLITVSATAQTRGTDYFILESGGAIVARHVVPIETKQTDYVAVAERLIHTPYLWGGNTGFGLDCSGLVYLAMRMCGNKIMRDTDMQAATLGQPVDIGQDWEKLQSGDLVFWRGHVAIAQGKINGEAHLIHANGYSMDVTSEPAKQAIERIAYLYELPIGVRRL